MKDVDQILHQTKTFENLKSIIKNGLHTSYALEQFAERKLLIPMISFSNIMFRDIGETEVVNYGNYGIGITRDVAIEFGLNPVLYVYSNSIIEQGIKNNLENTIMPQMLDIVKNFYSQCETCGKVTNYIEFNPLSNEVGALINAISADTDSNLIVALNALFAKTFENSYYQTLFAKPYKVNMRDGTTRFAYNEREWRKCFLELQTIFETSAGSTSVKTEFTDMTKKPKPHFTDSKYTLQIPLEKIKYFIVEKDCEVKELKGFIKGVHGSIPSNVTIDTLENLKKLEIKS